MICLVCKQDLNMDKIEIEHINEWEIVDCESCNAMYLRVVKCSYDYPIDAYNWTLVA